MAGGAVEEEGLNKPGVLEQFKQAGEIANRALAFAKGLVKDGADVFDICSKTDDFIITETKKVAVPGSGKKKTGAVEAGVSFPTCVSPGSLVCHFSPMDGSESKALVGGQLVRVDLGVQVNGWSAAVAETLAVPGVEPTEAAKAVLAAAAEASAAAAKLLAVGTGNDEVTAEISRVATAKGVLPLQGVVSHEVRQFVVDGSRVILQREDGEAKQEHFKFEEFDAFTLDVCFAAPAEGASVTDTDVARPTESEDRITIFKRLADERYDLKLKSSRWLMRTATSKAGFFPFALRALGDPKQARAGIRECVNHNLFHAYPILSYHKPVAHFKVTIAVLPDGPVIIAGGPAPTA